jgi:peptidoglycan hydrolase CwlO-like protein
METMDNDLYGDLENHGMLSDIEKLENELKNIKADNEKLRIELKEAQGQIECLNSDKLILKNNIVALFNTAIQGLYSFLLITSFYYPDYYKEIERKDRKISELNAQLIERTIKKQRVH